MMKQLTEFGLMGGAGGGVIVPGDSSPARTALAIVVYPKAKQHLIAQGRDPQVVEAMPVAQVMIYYMVGQYEYRRDQMFKWVAVPYSQAMAGYKQEKEEMLQAFAADPIGNFLPKILLPAVGAAYTAFVKLDRKFAALRCVEAIRLYAASHHGQLPASLDDIVEVPIPLDPITGKPFIYHVENNTAILEAPAPPGRPAQNGIIYEITINH